MRRGSVLCSSVGKNHAETASCELAAQHAETHLSFSETSQLRGSVSCLTVVYSQYGGDAPAEAAVAAGPAARARPAAAPDVDVDCSIDEGSAVSVCDNCPVNEKYVACAKCEPTCENPAPVCTDGCTPGRCQCIPGHARQRTGECVPVAACPKKPTEATASPPEHPTQNSNPKILSRMLLHRALSSVRR